MSVTFTSFLKQKKKSFSQITEAAATKWPFIEAREKTAKKDSFNFSFLVLIWAVILGEAP